MGAHRNVALTVAAFALAGILASRAHAQESMAKDARFTLPWTATWTDTVLRAGDYTLSVEKRSPVAYTVTFAGAGTKKTIVVFRRPGSRVGASSMLVVVTRGQFHSIRALHLPYADLVLTFPESKAERELLVQAPETMQSVPILLASK
jgi:hypothetical protein